MSENKPPSPDASHERIRVIQYLRSQARVWRAGTVRNIGVLAADIGRQLDLIASEIRDGLHLLHKDDGPIDPFDISDDDFDI